MISKDPPYIYFGITKTGSSTIRKILHPNGAPPRPHSRLVGLLRPYYRGPHHILLSESVRSSTVCGDHKQVNLAIRIMGLPKTGTDLSLPRDGAPVPGCPLGEKKWAESYDIISSEEMKNFYKFASIRNPFYRAVSIFKYSHGRTSRLRWMINDCKLNKQGFEKFLTTKLIPILKDPLGSESISLSENCKKHGWKFLSMTNWLHLDGDDFGGSDFIDDYIRFENFEEDVKRVLKNINIDVNAPLPYERRSLGGEIILKEWYTPESRKIVEDLYGDDLNNFNYDFS